MSQLPIWFERESCSPAPPGYVPLLAAMQAVGTAALSAAWTGGEFAVWGLSSPPPHSHKIAVVQSGVRSETALTGSEKSLLTADVERPGLSKQVLDAEIRQRALFKIMIKELVSERLEAAADATDGVLERLPGRWWRTAGAGVALMSGRLPPVFTNRWLFVTADSLRRATAVLGGLPMRSEGGPWRVKPGDYQKSWVGRREVLEEAERRLQGGLTSKKSMNGALAEMAAESGVKWSQDSISAARRIK